MNKKTRIQSVCALALLCAVLSGCGVLQGVKDGTTNVTKSIFYTKLKILKIDLVARNGLNQMNGVNRYRQLFAFISLEISRIMKLHLIVTCLIKIKPFWAMIW